MCLNYSVSVLNKMKVGEILEAKQASVTLVKGKEKIGKMEKAGFSISRIPGGYVFHYEEYGVFVSTDELRTD